MFGEAIRVRLGHEGRALMMGLVAYIRRERDQFLSPQAETELKKDHVRA